MRISNKKKIIEYILTALILLVTVLLFFGFSNREFSYQLTETSNVEYVRGRVLEIIDEDLALPREDRNYYSGRQNVSVEILEGKAEGEIVTITHMITSVNQVILSEGDGVIVIADIPDMDIEPMFQIYNHDRSTSSFLLIGLFLLLVVIVGRKQGLMSCIGLIFTIAMVICHLLPSLYEGEPASRALLLTVISSSAVTCFCISGLSKKTGLNFFSVVIGSLSAGMIFRLFMSVLDLTGNSISETEGLLLVSSSTGLQLSSVLFAGVTVSALGAVMDVAVSMGASLSEIKDLNPDITGKELFRSGMNIGRDMIGTMTNTLILAFAGGTLATLLVLISYGVRFHQLMSSDFMALELATGLSGSAAVVLTVPISALVCAVGLCNNSKEKSQ